MFNDVWPLVSLVTTILSGRCFTSKFTKENIIIYKGKQHTPVRLLELVVMINLEFFFFMYTFWEPESEIMAKPKFKMQTLIGRMVQF